MHCGIASGPLTGCPGTVLPSAVLSDGPSRWQAQGSPLAFRNDDSDRVRASSGLICARPLARMAELSARAESAGSLTWDRQHRAA